MQSILKGMQISKEIPYRDPDAFFSLVGTDGSGKSAYLPIGDAMLSRHLLLLGAPATGKTNMLLHLFRNLRANLTDRDLMIVFDPTGEYSRPFAQAGDVVFADDERASDANGEAQWNLFAELMDDARVTEDATALCGMLFGERIRCAADPYAATAARDLMMALIVYLRRQEDDSLRNNETLRGLIDGFDVESMRAILESQPELSAMTAYLAEPSSPKTLAVVAALQQAARELFQGRFNAVGTLGIRQTVRACGGKVVFLCYDPERGHATGAMFAALLDLALQEILARKEAEESGSVYLLLDGVSVLPRLNHLEDALQLGRSRGLRVMMAPGSVNRLRERYGDLGAQALLDSFGTTVAFRQQELASRSYVKQLYGRHRVVESFASTAPARGVVEQIMDEYVVEDEDLTALQTGEGLIATMHYAPFLFRTKQYGG